MQDPRVRGGPDQQAGPGEKGVSGGHCVGRAGAVDVTPALPQPASPTPLPLGACPSQVTAVVRKLWAGAGFSPFQRWFWCPVPL